MKDCYATTVHYLQFTAPFTGPSREGIREAAISAMDRRVTKLEDCVEDRLYDMVRLDVGNLDV